MIFLIPINETKIVIEHKNKADTDSVHEMNEINKQFELLADRLNVLLGNILVN